MAARNCMPSASWYVSISQTMPMAPARFVARLRAIALGRYPSSSMACWIRTRVAGATSFKRPLRTNDTSARDTFAVRATSAMVTRLFLDIIITPLWRKYNMQCLSCHCNNGMKQRPPFLKGEERDDRFLFPFQPVSDSFQQVVVHFMM